MNFNLDFTPEEWELLRFAVYYYERAYFSELLKANSGGLRDPISQKRFDDLVELGARLKDAWLEGLKSG